MQSELVKVDLMQKPSAKSSLYCCERLSLVPDCSVIFFIFFFRNVKVNEIIFKGAGSS